MVHASSQAETTLTKCGPPTHTPQSPRTKVTLTNLQKVLLLSLILAPQDVHIVAYSAFISHL